MRRLVITAIALSLLAALFVIVVVVRPWTTMADGSPDDRMLAAIQYIASDAQTTLDERGESPAAIDDPPPYPGLSYRRLTASSIRVCGQFKAPSAGQFTARPFFDVTVGLRPELRGPRLAPGRHCYDLALISTDPSVREDALLFRAMNEMATAAECKFEETGVLPDTALEAAFDLETRRLGDPACRASFFMAQPTQAIEYTRADGATLRMCAHFHRGYPGPEGPARVFDPARQAHFGELTEPRNGPGRRCYDIRMLLPDPPAPLPASTWDEPIDVEELPFEMRGAAAQDKEAIDDVVNVLRLARCAFTLGDEPPSTIRDAIQTVAQHQRVATRYQCDWAPNYFAYNTPVATYEPIDDGRVRVCARFRAARARPLELNYYGEALADWPTSLPQLQRPIPEPGRHCYTVRLTAIGSGET